MNEEELLNWFLDISAKDWFEMSSTSAQKGILESRERSFLYNMGRLAIRKKEPSSKQLSMAKKIYDKYHSEITTHEQIVKKEELNNKISLDKIKHMTLRVAWHDNKWNGKVCKNPELNDYCIGEHSLLSKRIRHSRNLEKENAHKEEDPNLEEWDYLPPCFWSINLRGDNSFKTVHRNPAAPEFPEINDSITPNTVYTWPFKLSFNRSDKLYKQDGAYPKNLESRVERFRNKFKESDSIIFLYSNYSNPVSGDEDKYLILGCSLLKENIEKPKYFNPTKEQLDKRRENFPYKYFPKINWAMKVKLDFPKNGVILPYHEYLEDAEETNNYEKLDEMKVTVDESHLTPSFKYVAMDIDDDTAIYILTKIKRSLYIIKDHGRITEYEVDEEISKVERFLQLSWEKRGHFPSFNILANLLVEDKVNYDNFLEKLKVEEGDNYIHILESLLSLGADIPNYLRDYKGDLRHLAAALHDRGISPLDFLKLTMLNLSLHQFNRIIKGNLSANSNYSLAQIIKNPYLLYEEYEPDIVEDENEGGDLDAIIPLYKIDIAYFPDKKYLEKIWELQEITESDVRRIRALVLAYLKSLELKGDCFDDSTSIEKDLKNYPLFYKSNYAIRDNILEEFSDNPHIKEKLYITKSNTTYYYYLREVYNAEDIVGNRIKGLLEKKEISFEYNFQLNSFINNSVDYLKGKIRKFDETTFKNDREKLFNEVLKKRFYVISGSPGSGKSNILLRLLQLFNENSEDNNIVLAPTGKATLRLNLNEENISGFEAKTIDKFLTENRNESGLISFNNLIIDEMSMVDLFKLKELFNKLNFDSKEFKRVIFVGDHNQLPPIGFGKVFVDTIDYLKKYNKHGNYIYLQSNCRQELDNQILEFAKVFSNRKKNYEDIFQKVLKEDSLPEGFNVDYWKNRYDLRELIIKRFKERYEVEDETQLVGKLNTIFGLRENGTVNNTDFKFFEKLSLDKFQIITPYKTAYYGTLGLNNYFQETFRKDSQPFWGDFPFKFSDKVIQVQNVYDRNGLILSNGSIGVAYKNQFYFPEYTKKPIHKGYIKEGSIELGYAITVHKSQGSGFEDVFLIIPNKMALLSRELIYTALTRSRKTIHVFIYGDENEKIEDCIFFKIKNTTHIDTRKTTLFERDYWDYTYSPAKNVIVKSRAEYIIYKKLQEFSDSIPGFSFEYEAEYELPGESFNIHPDFTIHYNDNTYYWEHLGMLGDISYEKDWFNRLAFYKNKGDYERLITTEERKGITDEFITKVIENIIENNLEKTNDDYSQYHYHLA